MKNLKVEKPILCLGDVNPDIILPYGDSKANMRRLAQGLPVTGESTEAQIFSGGSIGNHYLVSDHDKYIWYDESGKEQYFELSSDPNELHDRIDDPACAERVAYLRSELVRMLKDRPEGYSDGERLIPGRPQLSVLFE